MIQTIHPTLQKILDTVTDVQENGYGSVEIYIQDGRITQITKRQIEKIKED